MEDEAILALYAARNEEAIRCSAEKYGKYCHTIANRILQNDADSEECVSDTWLRAWCVIPPQKPQILSAFFGTITRNLALNRYAWEHTAKRGKDTVMVSADELSECIPDTIGTKTEDAVLKEVLNLFLSGLSKEARVMFVRRYWYLDSIKEIANHLGIGESKVKMSLLRSRKRLREFLEKEGIEV